MNKDWSDRFRYLGTVDAPAPEQQGFLKNTRVKPQIKGPAAPYFADAPMKEDTEGAFVPQEPQPVSITSATLREAQGRLMELEVNQVASLTMRGIQRYASTAENVLEFQKISADVLQFKGMNIGTTNLHIWDNEGRITVPIRVIPQRQFQEYARRNAEKVEKAEPFKIEYALTRSAFYDGNSYEQLDQTSLSFSQDFRMTGDTPYGQFDGYAQVRDFEDGRDLSTAVINLYDGSIGSFQNFDFAVGDTFVEPGLYTVPTARFRGVKLEQGGPLDKTAYTAYYGRELNSILGTLALVDSNRSDIDSFLGGAIYDYRPTEAIDLRFSYAHAYGQEREDVLNNDAFEFVHKYKLSDTWNVGQDIGTDSEKIAQKSWTVFNFPHADLRAEYRDVSKNFFSIIGNPTGQGEQGTLLNFRWQPLDPAEIHYNADIYRDRLFPFPGQSERYNIRQDADLRWSIDDTSNMKFDYAGNEATALLAPFRDQVYGATYNKSFRLWNRHMSVFSRFQYEDNENLTNEDASYRRDTLSLGYQTLLFWDILFAFSQSTSYLKEVNTRNLSHPRTTVYSLNRDVQIGETPFYLSTGLRYTDEEEAEAPRSFMIGEDRLELTGGLKYELQNMEFYVDGRYTAMRGEVRTNDLARAEGEIITGMRYEWDTGVRWEPSAQFRGYVFNDFNSNGVRDSGEPGVPDAVVLVSSHRVETKNDGSFETPAISGKTARISLDDNSVPYGFAATTKLSQDVQIREAQKPVYFGLVGRSSVSGVVFSDLNGNGTLDAQDHGVEGVRVTLDGKLVKVSDRMGRFRFLDVVVGKHQISMDVRSLPVGYLPQRIFKQDIEVFEGMSFTSNLAVTAQRSVSGRIYEDLNGNGGYEPGETPVANAKLRLGDNTAVSDDEGYYLIDNIRPGRYKLTVDGDSAPGYRAGEFSREMVFRDEPSVVQLDIALAREEGAV